MLPQSIISKNTPKKTKEKIQLILRSGKTLYKMHFFPSLLPSKIMLS